MQKAQEGDHSSYEILLKEFSSAVRAFYSRRINHAETVEDLVQESLMGIHRARHTYDSAQSFASWAFAIARYKMTDYFRKRERVYSKEVGIEDMEQTFGAEDEQEQELSEELEKALSALPQKQRQTIEALKIQGKSVREVSKELQMSESAVKVTAHRGYKSLRERLFKPR